MFYISSLTLLIFILFFYKANSVGLAYTPSVLDVLTYEVLSHKIQSFVDICCFFIVSMRLYKLIESRETLHKSRKFYLSLKCICYNSGLASLESPETLQRLGRKKVPVFTNRMP